MEGQSSEYRKQAEVAGGLQWLGVRGGPVVLARRKVWSFPRFLVVGPQEKSAHCDIRRLTVLSVRIGVRQTPLYKSV